MISRFRSARHDPQLVVLEGLHALKHAHRFGAEIIEVVVSGDHAAALARKLAADLALLLQAASGVDAPTFARLAPAPPPTGVLAIARRRPADAAALLLEEASGPIVHLETPTHLGNLGACIRVAAAAGAAGVITSGRLDPWAPEAVRGAAGLQFALPVARCDELPASGRPIVAMTPAGEPLVPTALPASSVFAFGGERIGLSAALLRRADRQLAIPMREGVSSLNLATSVAVCLYAWRLSSGVSSGGATEPAQGGAPCF